MAANCDDWTLQHNPACVHPPDPCHRKQPGCKGRDDLHGYAGGNRKDPTKEQRQTPWSVCRTCVGNIKIQPFYKQFLGYLRKLPPHKETKKWRGYWTRLCSECQIREQFLINERRGVLGPAGIALIGTPPPDNAAQMVRYPWNTCICPDQLKDNEHLCMWHRRQEVEALRTNLNVDRDRNKEWLMSIGLDPMTGELCTASDGRRLERADNRKWRACRCGAEVVEHSEARIFQCMTCEGIHHPRSYPIVALSPFHWNRNS
ncbi:hypothetical protein LTR85_003637 [Meristemomyces frigidus]|nr:hypothetical protein LTR85_003637 [Meristemomyces frigidus]